jgi:hypothetical protein
VGLISLLTQQIRLHTGAAGGLVTAGLVTAALGVLVWRGSRLATLVGLTAFGLLLVVQVGDLPPGMDGGGAASVGVLALLVLTLGLAAWRKRRAGAARGGGSMTSP